MADAFRIEIFGEVQLLRTLSRFGEGVQDYTPVFHSIVERLQQGAQEQFDTQGQGAWAPLSPKYAKWKAQNYPGKPILQRTGDLLMSLTSETGHSINVVHPLEMRWGTDLLYARFHQLGTRRMPQRRIIELSEEQRRDVMKEVQKYLVGLWHTS